MPGIEGRLTFAQEGSTAAEMFVYEPSGRATRELECLPTQCGNGADDKWLDYSYDLAGDMTSATDAAGETYTYAYSPAGEVTSISQLPSSATQPAALVSNVQNGADGPVSYQLGNGLNVYRTYDGMGRVQGAWVCTGPGSVGCGDLAKIVQSYWISWRGPEVTFSAGEGNMDYGYDELGRLTSMTDDDTHQQLYSWVYDRYGNRWQQNALEGGNASSLSFNEANNQIDTAGYAYDAAGNMTQDPEHHYSYDAEGNLVAVDGGATATYTYGPMNQRVETSESGAELGFLFNLAGQWASAWDLQGQNAPTGAVDWDAIGVLNSGGSSAFMHMNWEGTLRAVTGSGLTGAAAFTNLPFGDGSNSAGNGGQPNWFAGMQLDGYGGADSGTDHATFRQYGNTEGRWMSPDPYAGSYNFADPQSLNRYSYVLNNPLGLTDPLGLDWTYDCGNNCVEVIGTDDDGCLACAPVFEILTVAPPHPPPYQVTVHHTNPNVVAAGNQSISNCAANFADKYSIAGSLHAFGIGNSGVGGFVTNALGGNAFSGFTNLVSSFGSGSAGGHNVFYNMGQGVVAGPLQGIPGGSGPWGASASDLATGAIAGGAFSAMTGAGETLQGLNGAASLSSVGIDAVEDFATGVGLIKFGYDALSYGTGLLGCKTRVIH